MLSERNPLLCDLWLLPGLFKLESNNRKRVRKVDTLQKITHLKKSFGVGISPQAHIDKDKD